jgi:nuclease S1
MDPYHYVNLPKDANAYDQQRNCKLRNCVIEAIAWYKQVLKLPNAPRNEKRTAAVRRTPRRGLTPAASCRFAEDRGGTDVDVRFNGRRMNLHGLWDTGPFSA